MKGCDLRRENAQMRTSTELRWTKQRTTATANKSRDSLASHDQLSVAVAYGQSMRLDVFMELH